MFRTRLLWTMVGRVALSDADARIRLALQACRALTSALLSVVPSRRAPGRRFGRWHSGGSGRARRYWGM